MKHVLWIAVLLACGARPPAREVTSNELELGPDPHDLAGDSLRDADDRCPCAAEHDDELEDVDGCPELDDDRDGVPDACDDCPTDAEIENGVEDWDGCPDTGPIDVSVPEVSVPARVTFEPGTASLSRDAYVVIERVAAELRAEASITRLELLARARRDEVERAADVDRLARERGELVATALLERGIAPERLAVIVLGAREPLGEPIDRSVSFRIGDSARPTP